MSVQEDSNNEIEKKHKQGKDEINTKVKDMKTNADEVKAKAVENRKKTTVIIDEINTKLNLEKKIPSGAGLGGGSSDGASLVKALEKLTEIHLSDFQLDNIASKIGSDVFFFIHCDFNQSESEKNLIEGTGCALVSGRGEIHRRPCH